MTDNKRLCFNIINEKLGVAVSSSMPKDLHGDCSAWRSLPCACTSTLTQSIVHTDEHWDPPSDEDDDWDPLSGPPPDVAEIMNADGSIDLVYDSATGRYSPM